MITARDNVLPIDNFVQTVPRDALKLEVNLKISANGALSQL